MLYEAPAIGSTRSAHRIGANRHLAGQLQASPDLRRMLDQALGTDVLGHMQSGRNLLNPPGTVWHHPVANPNTVLLLRREEHMNPALQPILHPEGSGGFARFYK